MRFWPTDIGCTRPSRWRSSGTSVTPRAMRCAIEARPTSAPSSRTSPLDRPRPAGERLEQLGAPGAHQPVEADDLAGADAERHVVDRRAGPGCAGSATTRSATCSSSLPDLGVLGREELVRAAADHLLDDPADVDVGGLGLGDQAARRAGRRRGRRSRAPPRGGGRCRRSRRRAAVSSRMTRNRTSTSAALSAEVGSSMISTRASCDERPRDLDDLLLADAQVADVRVADRAARRAARAARR